MNSKVSFVNFNYLKENFKKSKGVILLFILIVPIFTYLFMLMLNSSYNTIYFPSLADLSIPALVGMYIIPFITAVTLFNFVFKKESVDFINALPMKRSTIYITNIVGGLLLFFFIFLTTSLFMLVISSFFEYLVIPSKMYFHFFITFFVTYSFTFISSSLTLSLTGSRMAHVALTLILLFLPSFISDFYDSFVYDNRTSQNSYYSICDTYDEGCRTYQINNELKIEQSYKFENGKILPYKYISFVPRAIFGMYNNEATFNAEVSSVYNISSIIRMILLSVLYFVIGLYFFGKRKMEIAESTFTNEDTHQIVKCLTVLPLCLGALTVFSKEASLTALWIFIAIIITIYAVYDLITRRNSGQFIKSVIYFMGLVLVSLITYFGVSSIATYEANRVIEVDNVSHIGIAPDRYFSSNEQNTSYDVLDYKLDDKKIIDFIFSHADKKISSDTSKAFAIRFSLKNGKNYYFNMQLPQDEYNKMLDLLDKDKDYAEKLKYIPYNNIYGVRLGNHFYNLEEGKKIIDLIKEGFKDLGVSDIVNATYYGDGSYYGKSFNVNCILYTYDNRIKSYSINTAINSDLINYVMQMENEQYITKIKNKNVNINRLMISINHDGTGQNEDYYYALNDYENKSILYKYLNDNVKSDIDFSSYDTDEIVVFNIWGNESYLVFLIKDENFEKLINVIKENVDKRAKDNKIKGSI